MRAVTQGIVITDPHRPGNPIVYVNSGFEAITGYTALEAVGRNCRFLQGKDTDPAAARALHDAVESERAVGVELLNYRKDGTPFWNALFITPVRDDRGALLQFIGVQVDVTAQRETERALRQSQRLESVGRLAGGVAHDFNNLMTIILANVGLLQADLEPGDTRAELAQAIEEAGQRAASVTAQLLAFSRKQILRPRLVDVGALVRNVQRLLERAVTEEVMIRLNVAECTSPVLADTVQLEQVLLNLARNGMQAMPPGDPPRSSGLRSRPAWRGAKTPTDRSPSGPATSRSMSAARNRPWPSPARYTRSRNPSP
jgi:PAS domain S-box-containing protein